MYRFSRTAAGIVLAVLLLYVCGMVAADVAATAADCHPPVPVEVTSEL